MNITSDTLVQFPIYSFCFSHCHLFGCEKYITLHPHPPWGAASRGTSLVLTAGEESGIHLLYCPQLGWEFWPLTFSLRASLQGLWLWWMSQRIDCVSAGGHSPPVTCGQSGGRTFLPCGSSFGFVSVWKNTTHLYHTHQVKVHGTRRYRNFWHISLFIANTSRCSMREVVRVVRFIVPPPPPPPQPPPTPPGICQISKSFEEIKAVHRK